MGKTPDDLSDKLGIAMAERTYKAYRDLLDSDRWQRLANYGARPQRVLWASTGTKDPKASDYLYVRALASPNTVNTMPEGTLLKFGEHGTLGRVLSAGGGDAEETIMKISRLGVDMNALGAQLQKEGADSFVKSWNEMMDVVATKAQSLK
jgi:transaldolase